MCIRDRYSAVVHFRLATHGKTDKNNCHPFDLRDFGGHSNHKPVAVIHNGIFYDAANDQKQWSDTWHICRDVLHPLWLRDPDCFSKPEYVTLGDSFVSTSNKLLFLNADGECAIWGEGNGHWKDGIWYSNHSYEDYRFADPRYKGSTKSYLGTAWDYSNWSKDDAKADKELAAFVCDEEEFEEDGVTYIGSCRSSVMDLDLELPANSLLVVGELRDCGYSEYEIEKLWVRYGHAGLIEELSYVYDMTTDQIESHSQTTVFGGSKLSDQEIAASYAG
jgi:hypothetical protein